MEPQLPYSSWFPAWLREDSDYKNLEEGLWGLWKKEQKERDFFF